MRRDRSTANRATNGRHSHYKEYIYGHASAECLSVNWCLPKEVNEFEEYFSEHQQRLFDLLKGKKANYSTGFEKGNYFENAYALVASNCRYAERIVFCGKRNEWNGTGSCQKWLLCSRCAFARA